MIKVGIESLTVKATAADALWVTLSSIGSLDNMVVAYLHSVSVYLNSVNSQ